MLEEAAARTTWVYTYDALNRLVSARKNGTLIVRYASDGLGRRIATRVYDGSTGGTVAYTRFVYRGSHVGFETDSAGTLGLRYTWGLGTDDLLAIRDAAGQHYYVVQDKLRSVRGLIRRDGTWIRSLAYGPYGAAVWDTASASAPSWVLRYRWTGREYDAETGWYFHRTRYYDPNIRRFVQEDKIGYAGGGNLYAYAAGNPINARDPDGLATVYDDGPSLSCADGPVVYLDGAPLGRCAGARMLEGLMGGGGRRNLGTAVLVDTWTGFRWAILTELEKSYTGNLDFASPAEYWAYRALKQRAYETETYGLIEMLRRAEHMNIRITFQPELQVPDCIGPCSYLQGGQIVIQMLPAVLQVLGVPAPVAIAHELGHYVLAPHGVPRSAVPGSSSPREYSGFYYEGLARGAFGCRPRPWDHAVLPPCW